MGASSGRPASRTISAIAMRRKISVAHVLHRSILGSRIGVSFRSINGCRTLWRRDHGEAWG
jgi:hypothetical protein